MPTLSVELPHFSAAVVVVTLDTVTTPGWVGAETSAPNTADGATTHSPPATIEMTRQRLLQGRLGCPPRRTLRTRDVRSAPIIPTLPSRSRVVIGPSTSARREPPVARTVAANYATRHPFATTRVTDRHGIV